MSVPDATRMTIGTLSRRTSTSVKTLREYEGLGLIYTVGRSEGNYRLFDEEALWCVGVVSTLRGMGLTLAEIHELAATYLSRTAEPIGPRLQQVLDTVKTRTQARIDELTGLLRRIDEYEMVYGDELAGRAEFRAGDPRRAGA